MQRFLLPDSLAFASLPFFVPQSSVPPFLTPGPVLTPEDAPSSTPQLGGKPGEGLSPQGLPTCEPQEWARGQHALSRHAALSSSLSLRHRLLSLSCSFTCGPHNPPGLPLLQPKLFLMLNPREQLLLIACLTLYINTDKGGFCVSPAPRPSRAAVGLRLQSQVLGNLSPKYLGISRGPST